MKRLLALLLSGLPALAVCGLALSAEPTEPGPPDPGVMFQRLDRNQDGKITLDEIPDGAPEFVQRMLKQADTNQDQVVTADELRQAVAQFRPGLGGPPPGEGRFGPPRGPQFGEGGRPEGRPEAGRPRPDGRPEADRPRPEGRPEADRPRPEADRPRPEGRPEADRPRPESPRGERGERGPQDAQRRPAGAAQLGDPQTLFDRLDRDKDGALSREEFAVGMRMFHRAQPGQGRAAVAPGGPRLRGPQAYSPWSRGPWAGPMGPQRPWGVPAWGTPRRGGYPMAPAPWMQGQRPDPRRAPWMQPPQRHGQPQFGPPLGPPSHAPRERAGADAAKRHDERKGKVDKAAAVREKQEAKKGEMKQDKAKKPEAQKPKAQKPEFEKPKPKKPEFEKPKAKEAVDP